MSLVVVESVGDLVGRRLKSELSGSATAPLSLLFGSVGEEDRVSDAS